MTKRENVISAFIAFGRVALCALLVLCAVPARSLAISVDEAQRALDSAEAQVAAISEEYAQIQQQIEDLQTQINETADEAMAAQQAVIDGQAAISEAANYEYRHDTNVSLLTIILESDSFSDLLKNLDYMSRIMEHHASVIEEQKANKERFDEAIDALNAQMSTQEALKDTLDQKREEAQAVVAGAEAQLADAQAAEAARLEQLRREAEALARARAEEEARKAAEEQAAKDAEAAAKAEQEANQGGDSGSGNSGNSGNQGSSGGSSAPSGAGWQTGWATAYNVVGTTANGSQCGPGTMGVAVPMSWPNYRSYFGKKVEISYGGVTVLAVINDCGYMGGGITSLDLQPGVYAQAGVPHCRGLGPPEGELPHSGLGTAYVASAVRRGVFAQLPRYFVILRCYLLRPARWGVFHGGAYLPPHGAAQTITGLQKGFGPNGYYGRTGSA